MAKHAKPTFARTLSRNGARTGAALAVTAAGLLAAGPIASAGEVNDKDRGDHRDDKGHHKDGKGHHKDGKGHHGKGHHKDVDIDYHESEGVINVSDNAVQACNNEVPILAVLVEDFTVVVPIVAEETGVVGDQSESCSHKDSKD